MRAVILVIFLFLISQSAMAKYTVAIYTDQKSQETAKEFVQEMNNLAPFNEFDIDYKIIDKSEEGFSCERDPIYRVIKCKTFFLSRELASAGYDQALIILEDEKPGGAGGGGIPVITTATEAKTLVHEWMHTLGFGDAYPYTGMELKVICSSLYNFFSGGFLNLVQIIPLKSGYPSDAFAKAEHASEIPWNSDIAKSTKISANTLGTPSTFSDKIGLFPARTCIHSKTRKYFWKPGSEKTIMDSHRYPVGALTPGLRRVLTSLGMQPKKVINNQSISVSNSLECKQSLPKVLSDSDRANIEEFIRKAKKD